MRARFLFWLRRLLGSVSHKEFLQTFESPTLNVYCWVAHLLFYSSVCVLTSMSMIMSVYAMLKSITHPP